MRTVNWSERLRAVLKAVARRRCPKCAQGRAFEGYWRMKAGCDTCGRRFQAHPGSTTGVMQVGAMSVVVFAIVAWFILAVLTSWSMDTALAVLVAVSILFGLLFYPYARLLWEAVDVLIDEMNQE